MFGRVFVCFLLLAKSLVFALGFNNNPQVIPVDAKVSFEVGQGAINSVLYEAFKTPISLGSGANSIILDVKRATVRLAGDSGVLRLDFDVKYNLSSTPVTAKIKHASSFKAIHIVYSSGKVRLLMGGLLTPDLASLPSYAKTLLSSHFYFVTIYNEKLDGIVTGLSGSNAVEVRAQVDDAYPIYYMGAGQRVTTIQNGVLRVTEGPVMERETPTIQFYRKAIGNANSGFWENLKSEITVVTNFKGTIRQVGYICDQSVGDVCHKYTSCNSGYCSGLQPNGNITYTGPFELTKEAAGDIRYRRYNYVAPLEIDGRYSGKVRFWVEIQHGSIRYMALTRFPHNTNNLGKSHYSHYPDVTLIYNY